jgi:hypothetical protein
MAYVQEVVDVKYRPFQGELPQLLEVVEGDAQAHQLPTLVARDAIALAVSRYARCEELTCTLPAVPA